MRGKFPKPAVLLVVMLGVALSAVIAIAFPTPGVRVKTLDPRFHLISAQILRDRRDSFYLGNQWEGRVRDFLQRRTPLKVKPLTEVATMRSLFQGSSFSASGVGECGDWALGICFRLDGFQASGAMETELVEKSGRMASVSAISSGGTNGMVVFRARGVWPGTYGTAFKGGMNPYWVIWDLDSVRSRSGGYRMTLKQAGVCLAEIELKHLPLVSPKPVHLGPNAF